MSELEKILKSVLLGSVGAVATAVEKTGELARSFVEKGEDVVDRNGLADKSREAADAAKTAIGKLKDRIALGDRGVDSLSKAQRDALRARLDELDAVEKEMQRELDAKLAEAKAAEEARAAAERELREKTEQAENAADSAADFFARLTGAVGRAVESANDTLGKLLDIDVKFPAPQAPAEPEPEAPAEPEKQAETPPPAPAAPEAAAAQCDEKKPEDPLLAEIRARLDEFARRIEANRRAIRGEKDDKDDKDGEG